MKVKVLIRAGLCEPGNERRFVAACEPGAVGTVIGRHPKLDGWVLVEIPHMGRRLIAPLGEGQFEPVEEVRS